MADKGDKMSDGCSRKAEQELEKQLKRNLESWREVLLPVRSVFVWEKSFYPGCLAGIITLFFLILWYWEPSVLTTLSVLGIIICILDYVVPIASASFFDPNKWTATHERHFEEVCRDLVKIFYFHQQVLDFLHQLKESKPKIYFVSVLAFLILMAWIGNMVDNLFLTYLLVLFCVLLPGMKHNGVLKLYVEKAVIYIRNTISSKIDKKKN